MSQKARPTSIVAGLVAFLGVAACAGFLFTQNPRMTAQRVKDYANSINFSSLSPDDRARAIRDLADKVNSLSLEERRRWRMDGSWRIWFEEMTEEEKATFIDATLPVGVTQIINEFENLPGDKRRRTIDDAMKQLRDTHKLPMKEPGQDVDAYGTNGPPQMSADLEKRVLAIGLRTYYRESSPQTKAELAPLLEELQHQMQGTAKLN